MPNKTMTITELSKSSKEFKDTHTLQVGGFNDNGKVSNRELLEAINKLNTRLNSFENEFHSFKSYVLDVFKLNNLK